MAELGGNVEQSNRGDCGADWFGSLRGNTKAFVLNFPRRWNSNFESGPKENKVEYLNKANQFCLVIPMPTNTYLPWNSDMIIDADSPRSTYSQCES
jgi:hypothetical protein